MTSRRRAITPPSTPATTPPPAVPVTALLAGGERLRQRQRSIATPEGIPLTVILPDHGTRIMALLVDLVVWAAALLLVILLLIFSLATGTTLFLPLFILLGGLFRSFYFLFFELRWQGRTPGKLGLGLRVVDRNGGPLRASAIVARNLVREVELFLPLHYLSTLTTPETAWQSAAGLAWLLLFLLFPLFNPDRQRFGDLLAGTMVIEALPLRLQVDLARPEQQFLFTTPQLATYGRDHLRVLEDVLRRHRGDETRLLEQKLAAAIAQRIGFGQKPAPGDARAFLQDYYTQFRQRMERELVRHGDTGGR